MAAYLARHTPAVSVRLALELRVNGEQLKAHGLG